MTDLKNKVALVTGSARGLGKAIAERYGALGANVVVNYQSDSKSALDTVASIERLGAKAIAVQADVSKVGDIERLFGETLERFSALDIVVANAGVELVGQPIIDFTEADFDRLFGINTKGAFFTLQAAARLIADHGRIIYVGSSNTAYPLPGRGLYGGSKIAAQFLIEVLAKEIGHRGVTANSILPTAIEGAGVFSEGVNAEFRDFIKSFRPIQRMGTMEDVADAAEYLAGHLASFVSGQHLLVAGGAPA
ncbi:SDR family NAD(P)-dependent oxidoreductase [Lysobacter sp. CA199]|uniref:SDR family NAD(P)-dependent oxidoreductase n=1 Tax=Lysobacter sp. CA199 TaxID=3455608 RepID=UPI003F8CF8C8